MKKYFIAGLLFSLGAGIGLAGTIVYTKNGDGTFTAAQALIQGEADAKVEQLRGAIAELDERIASLDRAHIRLQAERDAKALELANLVAVNK